MPALGEARAVASVRGTDWIPAILFGQLAVDKACAGRGPGSALLHDALHRAVAGAATVDGRAVVVRTIDAEAEASWRSNGFVAAADGPSPLFRSIDDIRARLGRST